MIGMPLTNSIGKFGTVGYTYIMKMDLDLSLNIHPYRGVIFMEQQKMGLR